MRIGLSSCLFLWVAGCGAGTQSAKRAEPATLQLLLYNLGTDGKALIPVAQGATLRSGESFGLRIEVNRPGYLHLWQKSGEQPPVVLLTKPLPLEAQRPLHLPKEGQSFTLDQTPGPEQLYVLVAPAPLSGAQQREALSKDPERPTRDGRGDPPPEMTEKKRGQGKILEVPLREGRTTFARGFFLHSK